jgi:acyl-CoA dehydrogenase
MLQAWPKVIAAEPIERKLAKAIKGGAITALDPAQQLDQAVTTGVITEIERELLAESRRLAAEVIAVDDFDSAELEAGRGRQRPQLVVAA